MPTPRPRSPANRAILRSRVVLDPLGIWTGGLFGLGLLLLPLAVLKASSGNWQRATVAGLLGVVLLLLTWRRVARRNRPMLLTSGPDDALHLEFLGRRAQGLPVETIPLASIKAYRYWLRLLKFRAFAQYHLRLELADGRVLHLADQPNTHPTDDGTATVRLDAVARRLARRGAAGPLRRQPFFLSQVARMLLWLSWAAIAVDLGLLGLGQSAGLLLLMLGASYWASYYLGRGSDAIHT